MKSPLSQRVFQILWLTIVCSGSVFADILIKTESTQGSSFFELETIPTPAINDSAAAGSWSIVSGKSDNHSAPLSVLNDGKIPGNNDSPGENFFFATGESRQCIALDLIEPIDIAEIATYSWHSGSRAPQVFTLYGSLGDSQDFVWNSIEPDVEPSKAGWTKIADIDSRTARRVGGQHASRIQDSSGTVGCYRYLLFEVRPTENNDSFGNTFFSEIDVITRNYNDLKRIEIPKASTIQFKSPNNRYEFSIDVTAAPELAEWSESELKPIILDWYPRIVSLLPSDGFEAPTSVKFRYQPSDKMEGIPAYAQGSTISMNAGWMLREKKREALGAIVHEMVHVVQSYQMRRTRTDRRSMTPGWIVEGIPDYIRWFLYEPQSKGAVLSKTSLEKASHDSSYRISANFIDWVVRTYDRDGTLLQKLNAAAREGRYSSGIWKELTGISEEELAVEWKKSN